MGFTERAVKEQKFLKEKYPLLWDKYGVLTGNICITEAEFKSSKEIRSEVFRLIAEKSDYSRYVLFRDYISDEEGELVMGYIVTSADYVE